MQAEGGLSVKAAMLGGRRKVLEILMDESRHDRDAHFIERKAEELKIPFFRLPRTEIDERASGRTHGGVLAEISPRTYQMRESALEGIPLIAAVEGVEDPFNLGYIMRTLYTAGCTGLLLRSRDWSKSEPVILKSSAGASEYLNVILSDDLAEDIRFYREKGVAAYAAMRRDAVPYWQKDYRGPVLIAIGGEMRGLSAKVLQCMDGNIFIPYANDFRAALNAAGAASALFFEAFRQREAVTRKNDLK